MANLADSIEAYLKRLLSLSASGYLEIKRKEVAGKFRCVPSQVNYVLETRFTLERGYLVESRRGGKGYLRIRKVDTGSSDLPGRILQTLSEAHIDPGQAQGIVERLYESKHISLRESKIFKAALECCRAVEDRQQQGRLRRLLLRSMIEALLY